MNCSFFTEGRLSNFFFGCCGKNCTVFQFFFCVFDSSVEGKEGGEKRLSNKCCFIILFNFAFMQQSMRNAVFSL